MGKELQIVEFEEAKTQLLQIAKDRHHTLARSFTKCIETGYQIEFFQVYLDGYSWYQGRTWDEAFKKLKEAMELITMKPKRSRENELI